MEVWKKIPGYTKYEVSNEGRVRSLKPSGIKLMKPHITHGHISVNLCNNNKYRHEFVHRLVALAFLPNPKNLPLVNHKNRVKTDNSAENLEWCSHSHNTVHGRSVDGLIMYPGHFRVASVMIPMVKRLVPLN